jgi:hypothetical protein
MEPKTNILYMFLASYLPLLWPGEGRNIQLYTGALATGDGLCVFLKNIGMFCQACCDEKSHL